MPPKRKRVGGNVVTNRRRPGRPAEKRNDTTTVNNKPVKKGTKGRPRKYPLPVTNENKGNENEIKVKPTENELAVVDVKLEESMECQDVKDIEAHISEQLENLGVAGDEPVENNELDVANYTEEIIDSVQYYEDIVDTSEVVIAEDTENNCDNDVNLELLNPDLVEEKHESAKEEAAKAELVEILESKDENPILMEKIKKNNEELAEKLEQILEAVEEKAKKKQKSKKKPKLLSKKNSVEQSKTDDDNSVRRSSRLKSITFQKQRSKGIVKILKPPDPVDISENSNNSISNNDSEKSSATASPSLSLTDYENKPVKVKSRWRRSSELEMNVLTPAAQVMENQLAKLAELNKVEEKSKTDKEEIQTRLKQFHHLKENLYLTDRMTCKEAKSMTCDCYLSPDEIEKGEFGCGEDCLNRLLMIECGPFCPIGDRCTNKKFQKAEFASVEVFKTEKKGLGLRATANIPYSEFILEYIGEVVDHDEFDIRADDYSNDKNTHYYFMSLRADAIIDATRKGNISRFINHSCEPNAETQKWTVNGELRIGFFSTRTILAGEEITFDYRFQRYGKEAQKCFCEASTCRGWLGEEPDDEYDDDEEDEIVEEEEVIEEAESKKDEKHKGESTDIKEVKKEKKIVIKKERKSRPPRKPRKDIFDDLDIDEEIEMLMATGLKNQAHTLKLSRLIVRAKEPAQRTKLLRILRRGELPCRRLFLDYHGLRLMHGYMIEAQHLVKKDKKYESIRLEILQTLATLPIPNKTMLQDSKVLPTVEKWSKNNDFSLDSDSSPDQDEISQQKTESHQNIENNKEKDTNEENETKTIDVSLTEKSDTPPTVKQENVSNEISNIPTVPLDTITNKEKLMPETNYEEEIIALALKLLEEWSNLKEVFKIPKKERIEQMKEHEREANRGYMADINLEQDSEKKNDNRYRGLKRFRILEKVDPNRNNNKNQKNDDKILTGFPKLGKYEHRKMFALQVEQREEERRRKQRELWRQHEQHCILLGTDPRLTAPFDPNRDYQCIWNPQIGQWQNYPLTVGTSSNTNPSFQPPNLTVPPPNPYIVQTLPSLPYQDDLKIDEDPSQVKFMGPIPPPVKLPPKWKCAKDKYGRPYYYHIKIRKSQWEPPPYSQPQEDIDDSSSSLSSSETSSASSDSTSETSDSDDDEDDTKLMLNVKKQMERKRKLSIIKMPIKNEENESSSSQEEEKSEDIQKSDIKDTIIKELNDDQINSKKRRSGLVHEIIISPRTEEDRLQFREDRKRYKQNREKLKKQKELIIQQNKKLLKDKKHNKTIIKAKMKQMADCNTEHAKKIKETFRSNMATVVVGVLNAYRKPDCKEGRITNTDDFKHLARKLTHFVMLKEMKHIDKIEDLTCTENVKCKAKEYIKKYMSKFGENYQKRNDEPDF